METREGSGKNRIFYALFGLFLICCSYIIFIDKKASKTNENQKSIGRILSKKNRASHRAHGGIQWVEAQPKMSIHSGDSVFTAEASSATVQIDGYGEISVDANSLVQFDFDEFDRSLDLREGSFRIKAHGDLFLKINGEKHGIKTRGSEFEVRLEKLNPAKILLLSGAANLGWETLKQGEIHDLVSVSASQQAMRIPSLKIGKLIPVESLFELSYIWKLDDHFSVTPMQATQREFSPLRVRQKVTLQWKQTREEKVAFELDRSLHFDHKVTLQSTRSGEMELNEVFIGMNFWRVYQANEPPSSIATFVVKPRFLKDAEPRFDVKSIIFAPRLPDRERFVSLTSPIEYSGFVAQFSTSSNFETKFSRFSISKEANVQVPFRQPGLYYARFKTINKYLELSDWSKPLVMQINTEEQQLAAQPVLAKIERDPASKPAETVAQNIESTSQMNLEEQVQKEVIQSGFIVEPFGIFSQFTGSTTSVSARIVSGLGMGVKVGTQLKSSAQSGWYGEASIYRTEFKRDKNSFTFETNSVTPMQFEFGYKYFKGEKLSAYVGASLQENIFFEQPSSTSIRLLKVFNKSLFLKPEYVLMNARYFDVITSGNIGVLMPTSIAGADAPMGTTYDLGLGLSKNRDWGRVYTGATFGQRFQKSSLTSFTETYLLYRFGLFYLF